MIEKLTAAGIDQLLNGGEDVVVQLLDVVAKGNRYRAKVHDGARTATATFASQLSRLFEDEDDKLKSYSIVRIKKCSVHSDQQLVVVLEMDSVDTACDHQLTRSSGAPRTPATKAVAQTPVTSTPSGGGAAAVVARGDDSSTITPRGAGGAIAYVTSSSKSGTMPIRALNPYNQRWTIKVRLTHKGEVVNYSNQRGTGTLLKVTFADEDGDDIEAVMFKEAVSKWGELFEEGGVYYVSGGRLKPANPQYSNTKSSYEITLGVDAKIERAGLGDGLASKAAARETCPLDQVENVASDQVINLLCVVKAAEDVRELVSTKLGGKQLHKRELTLVDRGLVEVRLTLWGDQAKKEVDWPGVVIACSGIKVGEYQGTRTLSSMRSSKLVYPADEPPTGAWLAPADVEAAKSLRRWWTEEGGETAAESATRAAASTQQSTGTMRNVGWEDRTTLAQVRASPNLGHGDKPDYISFKASISKIKSDRLWYEACSAQGCQKKVTQNPDGTYSCEKCNTTSEECEYRYMLSCLAVDDTSDTWLSGFNDAGLVIFDGTPASELAQLKEESENEYEAKVASYLFRPFLMRARVKNEVWNENSRIKISLANIAPVDYKAESAALLKAIHATI